MSTTNRKFIVITSLLAILAVANINTIAAWLQREGLVNLAEQIRSEYLTGTALTVILVLLVVLVSRTRQAKCRCNACCQDSTTRDSCCPHCGADQ